MTYDNHHPLEPGQAFTILPLNPPRMGSVYARLVALCEANQFATIKAVALVIKEASRRNITEAQALGLLNTLRGPAAGLPTTPEDFRSYL